MKAIQILFVLFAITIFSCDNNDDAQTNSQNPTDGFTIGSTFFETPNAYYEVDEDDDNAIIGSDGYPDNYSFFFSNGRMFDNDADVNGASGDYLFSLNTSEWVFLNVEVEDNPSLASNGPVAGNTYAVSVDDTVIVTGGAITPLTPSYFNSGFEFGQGVEDITTEHWPATQGNTITINVLNIDIINPQNSTIDVDYTFVKLSGDIIYGHYEGSLGIILD